MRCSRLARIENAPKGFDYIFVIKCGAAIMPEALIPIAGELHFEFNFLKISNNFIGMTGDSNG